ncbi:MAG: hypothetical protein P8L20_03045 [Flavobacteriales bacterium]|nr:hypothetical protein [Flavobacteriales bacterium]
MQESKHYLAIDLNGEQFLIDTFEDAESGQMMMKKVFEMAKYLR